MQLTLAGSSNGDSIIACRKNTLPRHALHNILSKAGNLSRRITPATKLYDEQWEIGKYFNKKRKILFRGFCYYRTLSTIIIHWRHNLFRFSIFKLCRSYHIIIIMFQRLDQNDIRASPYPTFPSK